MGYSIYIVAKNQKLKNQMLDFLNQEIPHVRKLHPSIGYCLKAYWVDSKVMGYVRDSEAKLALGFETTAYNEATEYIMWEVLRWAANKVGKNTRRTTLVDNPLNPNMAKQQPFIVLDGQENCSATPIPSLTEYHKNRIKAYPIAAKHYNKTHRFFVLFNGITIRKLQAIHDTLIARLEAQWAKAQP